MLLALLAMLAPDTEIEGPWKNPSGRVTVMIEPCGDALCGSVIKAAESAQAEARRGGTEQLVGTQLMSNLKPVGPGRWRGRTFVPDINYRANAELRLIGPNQLKVTGCMVGRMICKSQYWTRAD